MRVAGAVVLLGCALAVSARSTVEDFYDEDGYYANFFDDEYFNDEFFNEVTYVQDRTCNLAIVDKCVTCPSYVTYNTYSGCTAACSDTASESCRRCMVGRQETCYTCLMDNLDELIDRGCSELTCRKAVAATCPDCSVNGKVSADCSGCSREDTANVTCMGCTAAYSQCVACLYRNQAEYLDICRQYHQDAATTDIEPFTTEYDDDAQAPTAVDGGSETEAGIDNAVGGDVDDDVTGSEMPADDGYAGVTETVMQTEDDYNDVAETEVPEYDDGFDGEYEPEESILDDNVYGDDA